jgi:hypothetical protein
MEELTKRIGALSFIERLNGIERLEIALMAHAHAKDCLAARHNSVTSGGCPMCEGWGSPTGCRTCGTKCMGG